MTCFYTYFARTPEPGSSVKIGMSIMPEARVYNLRSKAGPAIAIVALVKGHYEPRFHVMFRDWHEGGEWFTASAELDATIEAINAGAFDLSSLPVGRRITGAGRHYKTHFGKFASPCNTRASGVGR